MRKSILVLFSCFCLFFASGLAIADSTIVNYGVNGHSYQRIDTRMTWSESKAYCESRGAYLATLTSQGENEFVYENLVAPQFWWCWLGGTDEASEGVWQWVTGEPWDYTNWYPGQPDDNSDGGYCQGEDYLHMYVDGSEWNDQNNEASCYGQSDPPEGICAICEWDEPDTPIPSVTQWGVIIIVLLMTGSAFWVLRRRKKAD